MKSVKLKLKEVLLLGLALGAIAAIGIAIFSLGDAVQALETVDTGRAVSVLP